MTIKTIINKKFPSPVSDWILDNVIAQHGEGYELRTIDEQSDYILCDWDMDRPMSWVLNRAFNWEISKEGDRFWREIYDKLLRQER